MAWNEPGNRDENPWGNNNRNDGPPDFDEIIRRIKKKIEALFGGGSGDEPANVSSSVLTVLAGLVIVWALFGCYIVNEQERAVVLRFGKYLETRTPGFSWRPVLIDEKFIVNITNVKSVSHQALMLTEDDNMIEVKISVQYRVTNPKDFWLRVRDPEITLEQAAESALRHVVGSTEMDPVLGDGRVLVAAEVKKRIQDYMNQYGAGIQVSQVTIDDAQPPVAVKAAFDNVSKAKEDQERFKNEAQSYANGVVPEAQGLAIRKTEEAEGYKAAVITRAEGEASRFASILGQYKKAPDVTRERLYIDAVQTVLNNSSKVLVDTKNGNPMFYIPLDKLVQSSTAVNKPAESTLPKVTTVEVPPNDVDARRGRQE